MSCTNLKHKIFFSDKVSQLQKRHQDDEELVREDVRKSLRPEAELRQPGSNLGLLLSYG